MLVVDRVHKDFGSVQAVRDVSFTIEPGSTFALIGPNGAGKTTTMRMILGIYLPDAGWISWNGDAVGYQTRRRFGYLPEERGLYGSMKVRDQIVYFGRLRGLRVSDLARRVDSWIERLGLGEYANRNCSELSKGNQQKVQIACAALHDPELLLLDEPFSGLDPVNAETVLSIFDELRSRGTTLVLSSHQMWQLEQICSRFCIIVDGSNRASGTLEELRAGWPTRILRVRPHSQALQRVFDRVTGSRPLHGDNGALEVEVPAETKLPELLRELVAADAVTLFESIEPSLNDIYLRAVGVSQ